MFLALLVVVSVAAAYMLSGAARNPTLIDPTALAMRIDMSGFTPDSLEGKVGQALRINLVNPDNSMHADGGGYHNFVLEKFGVDETVKPQSQLVFEFTPTEPGSYMWYCSICCGGKESPSMQGWIRVAA